MRERVNLGGLGADGRIILRWIFRKWDVGIWTGSSWLRYRKMASNCECDNNVNLPFP